MRLIGGKDFYDSGLQYGRDEDLIFVRDGSYNAEGWEAPEPYIMEWKAYQKHYDGRGEPHLQQIAVIFAGTLYRGFDHEGRFYWGENSLPEDYKEIFFREGYLGEFWRPLKSRTADYFTPKDLPDTMPARIITGIGIYNIHTRLFDWSYNRVGLSQIGFQKALDPFTAYQKLEAFVSNLPRNPNPMVEITDDKVKIAKHGFDKWSFRKMKASKK